MEAKDIIKQYQPLIKSVARQYKQSGIPEYLLEGEATLIANQALRTYDPSKGNLTVHLKNSLKSMNRFANDAQMMYIPQDRVNKISEFKDVIEDYERRLKRKPSDDEIADALKWDVREVKRMKRELSHSMYAGEKIEGEIDTFDEGSFLEFIHRKLPNEKEKAVLDNLFGLHGRSEVTKNSEIGKIVGLSESGVRKTRDKILEYVRQYQ